MSTQVPDLSPGATIGVMFIGLLIAMILHGIITVQTFTYYRLYPEDPKWTKLLVGFTYFLDALQVVFMMSAMYKTFVNDFGTLTDEISWSMKVQVAFGAVIIYLVRGFFALRVWKLSEGKKLLALGIFTTGSCEICVGTALLFIFTNLTQLQTVLVQKLLMWFHLVPGIISDLLIMGSMTYFLTKSRNTVANTNRLLNTLVLWTINTGLTMALTEVLMLITYLTLKNNYTYVAFQLVCSKIYTNCLLVSLNGRQHVKRSVLTDGSNSIKLSIFESVGNSAPTSSLDTKAPATPNMQDSIGMGFKKHPYRTPDYESKDYTSSGTLQDRFTTSEF